MGGLHGLFSTFSFFWIIAAFGAWLYFKKLISFYRLPYFLFFIIPITFCFTVLSSNVGRMLLSSFPIVIPYILIVIDYIFSEKYTHQSSLNKNKTIDFSTIPPKQWRSSSLGKYNDSNSLIVILNNKIRNTYTFDSYREEFKLSSYREKNSR